LIVKFRSDVSLEIKTDIDSYIVLEYHLQKSRTTSSGLNWTVSSSGSGSSFSGDLEEKKED
jgi:hypothetical protein